MWGSGSGLKRRAPRSPRPPPVRSNVGWPIRRIASMAPGTPYDARRKSTRSCFLSFPSGLVSGVPALLAIVPQGSEQDACQTRRRNKAHGYTRPSWVHPVNAVTRECPRRDETVGLISDGQWQETRLKEETHDWTRVLGCDREPARLSRTGKPRHLDPLARWRTDGCGAAQDHAGRGDRRPRPLLPRKIPQVPRRRGWPARSPGRVLRIGRPHARARDRAAGARRDLLGPRQAPRADERPERHDARALADGADGALGAAGARRAARPARQRCDGR